jgi:hypothetical protein
MPALDAEVLRTIEVILQLAVAAAVAVLLDRPLRPIEFLALEVIAPHLAPFGGQGGDGEQHQGQDEAHAVIFPPRVARTRS